MAQKSHKLPLVAYTDIRSNASRFRVEDIACIRLYGMAFGILDGKEYIEVLDPKVIAQFLDGLRHAEGPFCQPGCLTDEFEIRFRPRFLRWRKPFRLRFAVLSPDLSFGERFYAVVSGFSDPRV